MPDRTVTVVTTDHGPVTIPEPAWCAGHHPDGSLRSEIAHQGPTVDLMVHTERGPRPAVSLSLWQDPFPTPACTHSDDVHMAALLAAWNAAEPELPECHLCGNSRGPWVPEPSGDRWPSGAQKFVCRGGCKTTPATEGDGGTAAPIVPRRRAPLSVRMDDALAADLATMARAGMTPSDAVRCAVSIVAGAYVNAWDAGVVPDRVAPEITACAVRPYDGSDRP